MYIKHKNTQMTCVLGIEKVFTKLGSVKEILLYLSYLEAKFLKTFKKCFAISYAMRDLKC